MAMVALAKTALSDRVIAAALGAILVVAALAGAGTLPASVRLLPWYGAIPAAMIALRLIIPSGTETRTRYGRRLAVSVFSDPVLYAAAAFLVLAGIQWFNAGRPLAFDFDDKTWYFKPARIPWLPSAIKAADARQLWFWFFPAFTLVLTIRHCIVSRRALRLMLGIVLGGSVALAIVGIVVFLGGSHNMFGLLGSKGEYFASFHYRNHAAAFFSLQFCIAAGMILRLIRIRRRTPDAGTTVGLIAAGIAAVILIVAVHLARCLASMIFTYVAVAILVGWLISDSSRNMAPAHRVNAALLVAVLALGCFVAVVATAKDNVNAEFLALQSRGELAKDIDLRYWQVQTAWSISKEAPWFGSGAWAYKYLLFNHLTPGGRVLFQQVGIANVHNDIMQFLTEFGIVGLGLLGLFAAACLGGTWTLFKTADPLSTFALLGCGMLFAHSLVDLPFRCPAILFAWSCILAFSGRYAILTAEAGAAFRKRHGFHA